MVRSLLVVAALALAVPTAASDIGNVKCPPNQDRVWVYESLASFDVEARLHCGETVEIVSRVKGYVKVRTANGVEGYVPDSAFPDLPPLEDGKDKPAATNKPPAPAVKSAAAVTTPAKNVAPPAAGPGAQPIPPTPETAVAKPAPAVVTTKVSASPINVTLVDSGATILPTRATKAAQPVVDASDSDDYPNAPVENESADPACQTYFSAYGLAPSQFEWMANSRRKEFSGICPAPDPASVDYVILFTHDSDSYAAAMPEPVHVDPNGFSDFNPLTTVDTALISRTQAERARYEFVWVFRVKRGAFDPARFSPRRRPAYSTAESKGARSSQIIEDAFRYIEGQQGQTR